MSANAAIKSRAPSGVSGQKRPVSGPKRPVPAPDRPDPGSEAPAGGGVMYWLSATLQAVLWLAGAGLVLVGASAITSTVMHELYQLIAVVGGLAIIGLVGVWGAVDAAVKALNKR